MNNLLAAASVRLVHERAKNRCEYCHTAQKVTGQAMHIIRIYPDRDDHPDNLCLACSPCNLSKAMATSGIVPETGAAIALYNPRKQYWTVHFEWTDGGERLLGKTPNGRATIAKLRMNRERIVIARRVWIKAGNHPPVFD